MGRHTLEAKNFNHQYFSAAAVIDRERPQPDAAETAFIPADIIPAASLGTVTIEAFNRIAENFEVKKPTLKERLRNFGKTALNLLKSVRFEYAEPQESRYTEVEKQDIFAADRVNTIVQAHASIEPAFAPATPGITEGRTTRADQFDTPEDIADEDAMIKAQNEILYGISYEQQAEYAHILQQEEARLQTNPKSARVRLLTHDGPTATTPLVPHEEFVAGFQRIAHARSRADIAYYKATNTPQDKYGRFMPEEERVGNTY